MTEPNFNLPPGVTSRDLDDPSDPDEDDRRHWEAVDREYEKQEERRLRDEDDKRETKGTP